MAKTPAERAQAYRDRVRKMHGLPLQRRKHRPPLTCAERKRTSRERRKLQQQQNNVDSSSGSSFAMSTGTDPSTSSTPKPKNAPRTVAERVRAYRKRRKLEKLLQLNVALNLGRPTLSTSSCSKPGPRPKETPPRTVAERMRAYRARKKLQRLLLEQQEHKLNEPSPGLPTITEHKDWVRAISDEEARNIVIKVEPAWTGADENNEETDELPPLAQVNVEADYTDDGECRPSVEGDLIVKRNYVGAQEIEERDQELPVLSTRKHPVSAQLCQNSLGKVMIQLLEKPPPAIGDEEEDDDELYLRSLLPILKQFDNSDKIFVKVEIMNTIRKVQGDVWNRRLQNSRPS